MAVIAPFGIVTPGFPTSPAPAPAAAPEFTEEDVSLWEPAALALLLALGLTPVLKAALWTRAAARAALEELVLDGRAAAEEDTLALYAGEATPARWERARLADLTARHTAGTMLALGERALPRADRAGLARRVTREAGYLAAFRRAIEGADPPSERAAVVRAEMYADAAWSVPMGVEKDRMRRDGYDRAMRILGASDHCPGCITWSGFWMDIDECPPIGSLQCRSRCHCHISYKGPAGTIP